MPDIVVNTASKKYPIIVGSKVLDRFVKKVDPILDDNRLFVVFDAQVFALYGSFLKSYLKKFDRKYLEIIIPTGEKAKSDTVLKKLHSFLLNEKITRSDMVLAIGGGVCSDLAGYAAATVLRGVRWSVISTTLLGMVDASIGGKTGINHKLGKNLIGAFWQPEIVMCDTCFLNTLKKRQIIAGLGEIIK